MPLAVKSNSSRLDIGLADAGAEAAPVTGSAPAVEVS